MNPTVSRQYQTLAPNRGKQKIHDFLVEIERFINHISVNVCTLFSVQQSFCAIFCKTLYITMKLLIISENLFETKV